MRQRPLYGRKGLWLREFSDTAELTLDKILQTMQTYAGARCLCLKVADGTAFVGTYDPATPITSLTDLQAMHDACKAQSVAFLPVVVPRGVAGEAAFHGQIAQTCGALMVDIEPYAGAKEFPFPITFWDKGPLNNIPQYWKDLRSASGDAYLIAQPDPRHYGWSATCMPQAIPYIDGIAAQNYVGWLGAGWTDIAAEVASVQTIKALGKDTYVTIYGADPSFPLQNQIPAQFWAQVQPSVLGVCVFAFGPMNGKQLQAIAALPAPVVQPEPIDPPPPKPQPVPVVQNQRDRLALWSSSSAAELLDLDLPDSDVLSRVLSTAQAIVKELGT